MHLTTTQSDLEDVLDKLGPALNLEESTYNQQMLNIIALAKTTGDKEPTEAVKKAMCERSCEPQTLDRRVLEFKREALRSRLEVIKTTIMALQTQSKMFQEEMLMGRTGQDFRA